MKNLHLAALVLLASACSSTPGVQTWGTMREVLKEGRSEGRVELLQFQGATQADRDAAPWMGVGAMAGLAGEVTIDEGDVWITEVVDGQPVTRKPRAGDEAALLIVAEEAAFLSHSLGAVASLDELEERIAEVLHAEGFRYGEVVPVRVFGEASSTSLHVIDGACPIANPDGPPPARAGRSGSVTLVGFFARDAAGELTHHDRRTHLHALFTSSMQHGPLAGHLDAVAFDQAYLFFPSRPKPESRVGFGLGVGIGF